MPGAVKKYECEFEGCDWKVEADTVSDCLGFYKLHVTARHPDNGAATSKAEKAKRPELAPDVSEEDWSYFKARWTHYKQATGLKGDDIVTQLLECCTEPLRRDHHRTFSADGAATATETTVLTQLKQITVRKRNKEVNRVKLSTLKQDKGELVRKFAGRVRSAAVTSPTPRLSSWTSSSPASQTRRSRRTSSATPRLTSGTWRSCSSMLRERRAGWQARGSCLGPGVVSVSSSPVSIEARVRASPGVALVETNILEARANARPLG